MDHLFTTNSGRVFDTFRIVEMRQSGDFYIAGYPDTPFPQVAFYLR